MSDQSGGTWIPPEPGEHRCLLPGSASPQRVGWRWKCGTCGETFEVYTGLQYNEPFYAWRRVKAVTQ